MKRLVYLLIAALSTLFVASCIQDQFETFGPEKSVGVKEFTVTLNPLTRTALDEGKTVWAEGDQILVTNGVANDTISIPDEVVGLSDFQFQTYNATPTTENPQVYVIYPVDVFKKVEEGNIVVNVPGVQDGTFASANICVGESDGELVALRNITGVLKVNVPEDTQAPVYQLVFSAAGDTPLAGECTVDLSGDKPAVTVNGGGSSVTVQADGIADDFYAAVIPGTYDAGFKLTAATINFEYASETKTSTVANTVAVNEIVDLGVIGTNLQPLNGDGSKGNPFQIENLGHMIAVASAVDNGDESLTFEGQYFKVMNDIAGVTNPIGISDNTRNHPFCGDFNGNNKSITVDINGSANAYPHRFGLFGALSSGANIHDLVIEGKVTSTGDALGALVGRIDIPQEGGPVTLSNVVNMAEVSGRSYLGGIVGYAKVNQLEEGLLTIKNCINLGKINATGSYIGGIAGYLYGPEVNSSTYAIKISDGVNEGKVTGLNSVGGIAGYVYRVEFDSPTNTAAVTSIATKATAMFLAQSGVYATTALSTDNSNPWRNGTGGIVGFAENGKLKSPTNTGNIEAFIKVGGIAGVLYWGYVDDGLNKGKVLAVGNLVCRADSQSGQQWGSVAGGIAGWLHTGGHISKSINLGAVEGKGGVGGIVGYASCSGSGSSALLIDECENNATVDSYEAAQGGTSAVANGGTGGIVGFATDYCYYNGGWQPKFITVRNCVNNGDVSSYRKDEQANCVGGIVGNDYEANKQNGSSVYVSNGNVYDGCVNNGTVTGGYWVGGIMGVAGNRYSGYHNIINCANHGKVVAAGYSSKYTGICSGGLVGGSHGYNTGSSWRNRVKIVIKNSYNDGEVVYSKADYATPYVGGLVGSTWGGGDIQNCVNLGSVGIESGEAPSANAIKCLGALIGYQQVTTITLNSYYPLSILDGQAMGTNGAAAGATVQGFNEEFMFPTVVTYNEVDYDEVINALNAWVEAEAENGDYLSWILGANGPELLPD